MNDIDNFFKEHQSFGGCPDSRADHDAVKGSRPQNPFHALCSVLTTVNEAAFRLIAQPAQVLDLAVDGRAYDLRRESRGKCASIAEDGINPDSKNAWLVVCHNRIHALSGPG